MFLPRRYRLLVVWGLFQGRRRAMSNKHVILVVCLGTVLLSGCGVSSITDVKPEAQALSGDTAHSGQGMETASLGQRGQAAGNQASGAPSAKQNGPSASARAAAEKLTSNSIPGSAAYLIGPLDVLEVSVFKVAELSKSVQVSDAGTVNLPLVGEVPAAGRTARQVEQDLTGRLGKDYLQNPQVTVFIKEYNSQRITIEGAVKKPGLYPIQGELTLLQSIATASGLEQTADDTVVVFRSAGGKRTAARFNLSDIRGGTANDPRLRSGDVVVVNSSALKEAFGHFVKAIPLANVFLAL